MPKKKEAAAKLNKGAGTGTQDDYPVIHLLLPQNR